MIIRRCTEDELDQVHDIVHTVIDAVYPLYYPAEAVRFFHRLHRREKIMKDFEEKEILVLDRKGIIGTGTIVENNIRRMFILPEYQGKGHGGKLLAAMEQKIVTAGFDTVELDASIGAYNLYSHAGYSMREFTFVSLEKEARLYYFKMIKHLGSRKRR